MKPAATLVPRLRVITEGRRRERARSRCAFELTFEVAGRRAGNASDAKAVDAAAVVRAWQEGLGLVPLVEGGWASLPAAGWRSTASASPICSRRARTTGAWRGTRCPRSPRCATSWSTRRRPGSSGWRRSSKASSVCPRRRCRADLTATLRAYQRQGVNWLAFLRGAGLGGVLADDMGLGKTLQAMCVFEGPTLVVCPTSVLLNWQARAGALPARPEGRRLSRAGRARSTRPPT